MPISDDNFNQSDNQNNNYNNDKISVENFLDKITIETTEEKKVFIVKHDNNSGTGEKAPDSIACKFNWGAFLFNWIWGLKYKKWILLAIPVLFLIPYGFIAGIIMCIWAGMKGNQWAWEEIQYKNEEDFNNAQKKWVKACLYLFSIGLAIIALLVMVLAYNKKMKETIIEPYYSIFTSTELTIPQEVYESTAPQDRHYDFLTSSKNIIYWQKEQSELSDNNKNYIEEEFNKVKEQLEQSFILHPEEKAKTSEDSQQIEQDLTSDREETKPQPCKNKNALCIETWLNTNCNSGYCIINPTLKKYYKVRGKENVIPKALKLNTKWQ